MINKTKTLIGALMFLFAFSSVASAGERFNLGASAFLGGLEADGTEHEYAGLLGPEKNNHSEDAVFMGASIFAEVKFGNGWALGVDYVPQDADVSSSERSRTDSKGGDVITEADTGTRKASAEVQDLTTYYISKTLGDGGMYGLLGMHTATIASKTTLPNATYGSDDITGYQYGLGYAFDNGLRYEVSFSDFEGIELKDSTNVDTTGVSKITADLDVYMMKISYAF